MNALAAEREQALRAISSIEENLLIDEDEALREGENEKLLVENTKLRDDIQRLERLLDEGRGASQALIQVEDLPLETVMSLTLPPNPNS